MIVSFDDPKGLSARAARAFASEVVAYSSSPCLAVGLIATGRRYKANTVLKRRICIDSFTRQISP